MKVLETNCENQTLRHESIISELRHTNRGELLK